MEMETGIGIWIETETGRCGGELSCSFTFSYRFSICHPWLPEVWSRGLSPKRERLLLFAWPINAQGDVSVSFTRSPLLWIAECVCECLCVLMTTIWTGLADASGGLGLASEWRRFVTVSAFLAGVQCPVSRVQPQNLHFMLIIELNFVGACNLPLPWIWHTNLLRRRCSQTNIYRFIYLH